MTSTTRTTSTMRGVFAVPTTPFSPTNTQDLDALRSGVDRVLEAGVDGILALGATGEALALTAQEREEQVRAVIEHVQGRVPVVVGCMAYDPRDVAELIDTARGWGAAAAMVTPPYYGGISAEAAVAALEPVFAASTLPLLFYNNPHSTGTDVLPAHLEPLAAHDSFWAVKETSGAASRVRELRAALPESVEIFVGADGLALEGFVQGATGWVAASAWLAPQECVRLWRLADQGDWAEAVTLWRKLATPLGLIEDSSAFISLIKGCLTQLGIEQGGVRPPLPTAAPEEVQAVLTALQDVQEVAHA